MYKQNQQPGSPEGQTDGETTSAKNDEGSKSDNKNDKDDVVDADFEEVKEDKEKKSN